MTLKEQDFMFDYDALARLENKGLYFAELDERSYKDLVEFYSACAPHLSRDVILANILGGTMPLTVGELIEKFVADNSK